MERTLERDSYGPCASEAIFLTLVIKCVRCYCIVCGFVYFYNSSFIWLVICFRRSDLLNAETK